MNPCPDDEGPKDIVTELAGEKSYTKSGICLACHLSELIQHRIWFPRTAKTSP